MLWPVSPFLPAHGTTWAWRVEVGYIILSFVSKTKLYHNCNFIIKSI